MCAGPLTWSCRTSEGIATLGTSDDECMAISVISNNVSEGSLERYLRLLRMYSQRIGVCMCLEVRIGDLFGRDQPVADP